MKRILVFSLFVVMAVTGLRAQLFQLGLKGTYTSIDPYELYSDISTSVTNRSVNFLKQSGLGLMLRINVTDRIFVQPELGISPNAIWSEIDTNANFISQLLSAYNGASSSTLDIPVLVGYKLFSFGNALDIRVFGGAQFYTKFVSFSDIDFGTYSLLGGVGVDLIDFLYFDVRAVFNPGTNYLDKPAHYAFTFGLMF